MLAAFVAFASLANVAQHGAGATPASLLCEFLPSPVVGVDAPKPRFAWSVPGAPRGSTTASYAITVTQAATGAVVWSSGKTPAANSSMVEYGGKPLLAATTYSWTVQVTTSAAGVAQESAVSAPASFTMGLLALSDWDGAISIQALPSPKPPPPPGPKPPTVCKSNCLMVAVPNGYYGGIFKTNTPNIASIPDCQAACLKDAACVQITWDPDHKTAKCVLYTAVYNSPTTTDVAKGWVKCAAGSKAAGKCAPFVPGGPAPPPAKGGEWLRTTFTAPSSVQAATVFLSAVGWAEVYINGQKVAPLEALNPGRTSFDMRQWYMAHNVKEVILPGSKNAIAIVLAAGWQSMPGHTLSTRLVLKVADSSGKIMSVPTTTKWMGTTNGPIQSSNIYAGETYDARLEIPGFASANFSGSAGWAAATPVAEFTKVTPTWQPMQPIRALELNTALSFESVATPKLPPGGDGSKVHVYKFPQNAAGWAKITLTACPKGTSIATYFAENTCGGPASKNRWSPACAKGQPPGGGAPGTLDQRNLHGNWHNVYICKGEPVETWEPRFMYTGHRYVEMHGHSWAEPTLSTVQQRVVHSDVEGAPIPMSKQSTPRALAGSIAFGHGSSMVAPAIDGASCYEGETCKGVLPADKQTAVLDQISHNVRWDLIDNLHSVPEDCDQRNERWGWMADASVSAEGNYNYHWTPALYTSWLNSMSDVQHEPSATCAVATGAQGDTNVDPATKKPDCKGAVGDLTPGHTPAGLPGDPSWMFAFPLCFSYQHRYMGDERLAAKLWPGILSYADFLSRMASRGKTGLISWKKYGDWLEPGKVPSLAIIGMMSSAFNYAQTLRIARDTSLVLGDAASHTKYSALFGKVKGQFHTTWWNATTKSYGDGTQAAQVYALYLGAPPANLDAAVFANLLKLIATGTSQCDSTPCLDTGILATKWIMELLSIRGRTDVGLDLAYKTDYPSWGFMATMNATTVWEHWEYMNGPGMNSHAHPALASVGAWFYRWVAGLRLDDGTLDAPSDGYAQGWSRVLFSPGCTTDPRLPAVQARVSTLHGPIGVSWANASNSLTMRISTPIDTLARVVIPAHVGGGPASVTVTEGGTTVWSGGKPAGKWAGHASVEDGSVTLRVGSGAFSFVAK